MSQQTVQTTPVPIGAESLALLQGSLRGRVVQPGDADYDATRSIWNGMIDKKPVLIVQCSGVADVISAVNFARESRLLTAVRGGGHNWAGLAAVEGGILIDLS